MPMIPKDHLFNLIKSLTKAEKRNFKLYVNRLNSNEDVKFLKLFEVLDKQDSYAEEGVFKKMAGLKKGQLANLKRHLYTQILKSLRLIHSKKKVDIQIREQIDFAKILYGKGLYLQSLKLLERIKGIAREAHQDLLHLEIIELQKLIEERHITRSRKVKNKMEDLIKEADARNYVTYNRSKISNLKLKIHGLYIKQGHAKSKENHFIVKEYFKSNIEGIRKDRLSFFEKVYLHQCYVWYYYILLNFPYCYRHARRWIEIFKAHPYMMEKDADLYMRGLHYLLTALFDMNYHSKFKEALTDFEVFLNKYENNFNTTSNIIAFLYYYPAKLNQYFLEGSFEEGLDFVLVLEQKLQTYTSHIDQHHHLVFYYKIAWLYFGAGNLGKAIDYLNKIIQLKVGHLREDMQCYARLFNLIVHYELGNHDSLEYWVASVDRFFAKMKNVTQVQSAMLHFFNNTLKRTTKQEKPALKKLRQELISLAKDPYEKRAFIYLDVVSWLDSKIEEKPLAVIVQGKYERYYR